MNDQDAPLLRIVRGQPDDAEIAALTAATTSLSAPQSAETPAPLSTWANRAAALRYPAGRRPLHPTPGAWRAAALPR